MRKFGINVSCHDGIKNVRKWEQKIKWENVVMELMRWSGKKKLWNTRVMRIYFPGNVL